MNILPKKRWHVRTKENIARVRRDEAKAAEEEKARQDRAKLAERESRRQMLIEKSRSKFQTSDFIPLDEKTTPASSSYTPSEHINFFQEVEEGVAELKQTNKDHDKEVKEEKEKYEKQIGYLTYLGQDTNEALGKKSWYELAPDRSTDLDKGALKLKSKEREDPLYSIKKLNSQHEKARQSFKEKDQFKKYTPILNKNYKIDTGRKRRKSGSISEDSEDRTNKKSHRERKVHKSKKKKKHKSRRNRRYSSESSNSGIKSKVDDDLSPDEQETQSREDKRRKLEVLREERLKRERAEKRRTDELLTKLTRNDQEKPAETKRPIGKQKYNSQFNPELAKQNYLSYKK